MLDHLGLASTSASAAVLTGDPSRVQWMAEHWGGPVVSSGDRRGFHYVELADVVVLGTGIGSPAMAIAVEELVELGVSRFVRIGSCGGIGEGVRPGHLVVSTAATRDEGTSATYLPPGVPAVPDFGLLAALVDAARSTSAVPWHVGVTHCKDAYYSEKPGRTADPEAARRRWDALKGVGVLATEMEAAALFAVAQARGVQAAAVLVAVGADDEKPYLRPGLDAALELARAALQRTSP